MYNRQTSTSKRELELVKLDKISKDKYFSELRGLGITTYKDYLQSQYWKDLKLKMWSKKIPKECFCCGSKSNLDIHHRKYRAKSIDMNTNDLVYLCRDCHTIVHNNHKEDKTITINQATKRLRRKNRKNILIENFK